LRDDSLATDDFTEEFLDVSASTCRTLEVGIEIFRFEDSCSSNAIAFEALLLPNFGVVKQHVNLACVAKVGAVAHATEHLQRNAPTSFRGEEFLSFQLSIKDCSHLVVVEIFEKETRVDGKAPGESRVDVLHHFFHLLFVAEEQNAAIVAWHALDFSDDGDDYGSLVRIRGAVEAVRFVDDKDLAFCGFENAFRIGFRGTKDVADEVGGSFQDNCT